jgi:hypothetical protein
VGTPREQLSCHVYLDDFTITSNTLEGCLQQTLEAVKRLAEAGAMVNLKKSKVGGLTGKVLGHHWSSGGYFTPEQRGLRALLEMGHPQLQRLPVASVYGMLSFFRPYIADFAVRTEAIRELLAASHSAWTERHT